MEEGKGTRSFEGRGVWLTRLCCLAQHGVWQMVGRKESFVQESWEHPYVRHFI